jgi:hypothetical protein
VERVSSFGFQLSSFQSQKFALGNAVDNFIAAAIARAEFFV